MCMYVVESSSYRITVFDALLSLHTRLTGIDTAGSLHAQQARFAAERCERLRLIPVSKGVLLEHTALTCLNARLLCARLRAQLPPGL
jgi:hypothetical protein